MAGDHCSIPIVVLGLVFQDAIDHGLRNLWTTAAMLAGFGIIIGVIDRVAANAALGVHDLAARPVPRACAVARADTRGFPIRRHHRRRAGAGLPAGGRRQVLIPACHTGCGGLRLFKLADISSDPVPPAWGPIALATVVSFAIGYAVIAWLLRYVSTHTFMPFVIYRIALAALVVVLLLTGVLSPLPPSNVGQPG